MHVEYQSNVTNSFIIYLIIFRQQETNEIYNFVFKLSCITTITNEDIGEKIN